jgi:hypothetical protein
MAGLSVFGKGDEKNKQVLGCINGTIKTFAIAIFFFSLYQTIVYWRDAFAEDPIKDLLLSPVMTLLFLPFLYLAALYMGYETLFLHLGFRTHGHPALYKSAKRRLLRTCHLDLMRLNLAKEEIFRIDVEDSVEFQQLLDIIKNVGAHEPAHSPLPPRK